MAQTLSREVSADKTRSGSLGSAAMLLAQAILCSTGTFSVGSSKCHLEKIDLLMPHRQRGAEHQRSASNTYPKALRDSVCDSIDDSSGRSTRKRLQTAESHSATGGACNICR